MKLLRGGHLCRVLMWVGAASCIVAAGCVSAPRTREAPADSISYAAAVGVPLDTLIEKLNSGDPQQQVRARQLLPYYGPDAVEALVPILTDTSDPVAAKLAYHAVLETANACSVPGREGDRDRITDLLMPLVAPERFEAHKILGLRLLERTVSPDYPIDDIADMLTGDSALLREKARTALQRMGTEPARAALRSALEGADPDFQCALLNSLGEMHDAPSLRMAAKLTRSDSPAVRAAAARALSWSADPAHAELLGDTIKQADAATKADAVDALLRLGQSIEKSGESIATARSIYAAGLEKGTSTQVGGSMAGLGRVGDAGSARAILKAIDSADPVVRRIGIDALKGIPGADVTQMIVDAYAALPDDEKPMCLGVLAQRGDALAVPVLIRELNSEKESIRITALRGLGEMQVAESLDALEKAARATDGEEADVARESLMQIGAALQDRGENGPASKAYLAVCETAREASLEAQALLGLARAPSLESYDYLIRAADKEMLRTTALGALSAVAAQLFIDGDLARSQPALDKVLALDNSIQSRQRYISTVRGLGGEIDAVAMLGTLEEWWLLGPFFVGNLAENWDTDFIDPKAVDLQETFTEGDKTRAWKRTDAEGETGSVSLHSHFGMVDNSFGYAYCEVEVAERTVVQIRLGSDDGVVAWVNGAKVHNHMVDRGAAPDQDVVLTRLEAGRNRILLRISQGSGGWGFCSRLTTRDGASLDFQHVTPESAQ